MWALLTLYQLLRMAMADAVETRPGTDPDRASFTTAIQAAKDQLTAAAGICPDGPAGLTGAIGRAVLATLLPARRPRYSARKVKCATSRYLNRDDGRPAHPAAITAIDIAISTPPVDLKPGRTHRDRRSTPRPPQPPTRREKITAIITGQPPRDWSGHELAILLGVKPRNMLTQLGEWTRLGFFTRTGFGTLQTQHAASEHPLDKPARPLTSRLCYVIGCGPGRAPSAVRSGSSRVRGRGLDRQRCGQCPGADPAAVMTTGVPRGLASGTTGGDVSRAEAASFGSCLASPDTVPRAQ